jgi:hypothetical protein
MDQQLCFLEKNERSIISLMYMPTFDSGFWFAD